MTRPKGPPADSSVLRRLPSDLRETAEGGLDSGSNPGLGGSPGGGHKNPLQYSSVENPWTEEPGGWATVHSVTKSWTQLKQFSTHTYSHVQDLDESQ